MGAQPAGRMLLVDDVITAGTAVREAMEQLVDVQVSGLVVALDRQERGQGSTSAIQELRAQGLDVRTIVTLDDVLEFARTTQSSDQIQAIEAYRAEYGV